MANINVATGVNFEFGTTGDDAITLVDTLVDTAGETLNGNGGTDSITLNNAGDSLLKFLDTNGVLTYDTTIPGSEHWDLDDDSTSAVSTVELNGGINSVTFATGETLTVGTASAGTTALTSAIGGGGNGTADISTARAYEWSGTAVTTNTALNIGANPTDYSLVSVDGIAVGAANFSNADGQFNVNANVVTFTPNTAAIAAQGNVGDTASFTYDVVVEHNTTGEQSTVSVTYSQEIDYTAGNDTFTGTDAVDTENGLAGDDMISGGEGNDSLTGGSGNDTLLGENGNDDLVGDAGVNVLRGGNGNDELTTSGTDDGNTLGGGAGSDVIVGNDGDDIIFGGNGDDNVAGSGDATGAAATQNGLIGGKGDDIINGGGGDDILRGDLAGATLTSAGTTTAGDASDDGNDTLRGGDGNDTLYGDDGNDELRGGAGDDVVNGGAGADMMYVSLGDDIMDGGAGDDTFILRDDSGETTINGFAVGDKLNVEALGYSDLAAVLATSYETDAGVVIAIDADTTVLLDGLSLTDLDTSDFDFA
ncbi:calcium-binding protein (plasmid) [Phaeobacter inhibens]|uniref:calcium-binding protein n=1 Tax=Phaeobacter inhibens TaxID=221822 RepID=UPI0001632B22|nr:calcium-binding protein [Phaeobacter inhibens]AFO93617.1 hemolysin-like protein [Phaeobacter inhibens DSM 17395]AUQ48294.1 hemolysin-like protein [Phaeobacter inhibens]AXT25115.1 calcium-binding protein [Phaeobacter inhibens]